MAQLEIVNAVRVCLKSRDLDKKLYTYSISELAPPEILLLSLWPSCLCLSLAEGG